MNTNISKENNKPRNNMKALRDQLTKSLGGGLAFLSHKKAIEGVKPELRNVKPNENLH